MSYIEKEVPVEGMTCAGCAYTVEQTLSAQKGVLTATVNYATLKAKIKIDDSADLEEIQSAVKSAGYDLKIDIVEDDNVLSNDQSAFESKLKSHRRNAIGALILSMPVMIIGMFFMDMPYANYIMLLLTLPVVLYFGRGFYVRAVKFARHGSVNMDTLVALSTGIAFLASVFNTFYPEFWTSRNLDAQVYYEAAAVIIAFILLGKWLEERAKHSTGNALRALIQQQPDEVIKVGNDSEEMIISVKDIIIDDVIKVRPGDRFAVDGEVVDGSGYVDESSLTGEPVPVFKDKGDSIYAGGINQEGVIYCKAKKVGRDTVLAQIVKKVEDAQGSKAPVQKLVDKIASIFVPIVIGIAVLSFALWLIIGGMPLFSKGLLAFITVMVIACPCALGLATPTAIIAGMGRAAKDHILIKNAETLQYAAKTNVLVVDKTGTITEGKPRLIDTWFSEDSKDHFVSLAYSLENNSDHPIALAILDGLKSSFNPTSLKVSSFENVPGKGIKAEIEQQTYSLGSPGFITAEGAEWTNEQEMLVDQWGDKAYTIVGLTDGSQVLALFAVSDTIRKEAPEAISQLQSRDIEVHLLTGDNEKSALAIAREVGIDQVRAGVLPHEKQAYIEQLQQAGKKVAMCGDGINDAPALAQADFSIAMGKGTDIALETAEVALGNSDLGNIDLLFRLSAYTNKIIRQNLFWAFVYNVIGIPIAAGLLYPWTGWMLPPMYAGAAMAMSSVSVVTNSLRINTFKS